jgi:hypothetical protein
MGIEPTSDAWEACQNTQKRSNWRLFDVFRFSQMDSNWSSDGANQRLLAAPSMTSLALLPAVRA